MRPPVCTDRYENHRFPAEIISHGVCFYFRFCLSSRDVEELLFARGIIVTYEAIRKWCRKFGQAYANQLRCRRPRPGDKWHLDDVFLPSVEHRQHRYLNNRAGNSHQPTRQRERHMRGFKSAGHAQRLLSAYGPIAQHFRHRRHRVSASAYRQKLSQRFDTWRHIISLPAAV